MRLGGGVAFLAGYRFISWQACAGHRARVCKYPRRPSPVSDAKNSQSIYQGP